MELKDFTPKQAKAWVAQELAKVHTPEAARTRIVTEEQMAELDVPGMPELPNSAQAHKDLVQALRAKFAV